MNKQSSRTSLFLIELVLSIFFFIIAAAICLQLFIHAHFVSCETIETNQALLWSQNLAEPFLGSEGDYSFVKALYSDKDCIHELSLSPKDHILLCFDKEWNPIQTLSDASYVVFSCFYADENFAYQDIYIAKCPHAIDSNLSQDNLLNLLCEETNQIYQLSIKKMIPGGILSQEFTS